MSSTAKTHFLYICTYHIVVGLDGLTWALEGQRLYNIGVSASSQHWLHLMAHGVNSQCSLQEPFYLASSLGVRGGFLLQLLDLHTSQKRELAKTWVIQPTSASNASMKAPPMNFLFFSGSVTPFRPA